jgi:hypothetical protein
MPSASGTQQDPPPDPVLTPTAEPAQPGTDGPDPVLTPAAELAQPGTGGPDPVLIPAAQPARPGTGPDPVLVREREYLSQSRQFLRLMREDVLSLRALGGDPVSEEYLKADLYRRAEALSDLPDTPLFFGRLDYAPAAAPGQDGGFAGERFHVGRRHVHDQEGHPVVVDWRAPVSRPFYRASPADPMGLELRRRFGFSGGELTAHEDEVFTGDPGTAGAAPVSRILIEEIERPRPGRRDIVATIAPDQTTSSGTRLYRRPGRTETGKPRSACRSPTCATPIRVGWPGAGSWSSGRTAPSCPTSAMCCPPSARST